MAFGPFSELGTQQVVDEVLLLRCAAGVHRLAEFGVSGDQVTVFFVTGASWPSVSQRTWVFS